MGRGVYTVSFFEQTIAAASGDYDFFELDPAADKPIELMGLFIGNKSRIGDAQEELVSWSITYFSGGTFTTGNGASATIGRTDPSDIAASFTAKTVSATVATSTGTTLHLHQDTFNIRIGLPFWFPENARHKCDGAAQSAMVVRLRTALIANAVVSGTLYVREL